jgi:hypothetical protein
MYVIRALCSEHPVPDLKPGFIAQLLVIRAELHTSPVYWQSNLGAVRTFGLMLSFVKMLSLIFIGGFRGRGELSALTLLPFPFQNLRSLFSNWMRK